MVDITAVLGLQGRARRNAKVSLRRLQRARAEAREAALACAQQADGTTGYLDPTAPEWAALAARFQDPQVDQRALLLELMRRLRSLDVAVRSEDPAAEVPARALDPA